MKELLLVSIGSFFGGGLRYVAGKGVALFLSASFPWSTLAVNVAGSFLIGFLSSLFLGGSLSHSARQLLVTGFCGGFTTFSTFVNENLLLARGGQLLWAVVYTLASVVLGMTALLVGYKAGQ